MRETYTARLHRKILLSASAECYHLEFEFQGDQPPPIEPGQFLSFLAEDAAGKTYTRAYSVASAPRAKAFDLCVNRVPGGFFSNLLCDLRESGDVRCHGPHGLFTLRQPPADCLMVAAGTGIAPLRGFLEQLFPPFAPQSSTGHQVWLIYEAPELEQLFYDTTLRRIAAEHSNFHYLPLLADPGDHGPTHQALTTVSAQIGSQSGQQARQGSTPFAYLCGLAELVKPVRAKLLELGWEKQQILFERYD